MILINHFISSFKKPVVLNRHKIIANWYRSNDLDITMCLRLLRSRKFFHVSKVCLFTVIENPPSKCAFSLNNMKFLNCGTSSGEWCWRHWPSTPCYTTDIIRVMETRSVAKCTNFGILF